MESRKCTICGNQNNDKMLLIYFQTAIDSTVINFVMYNIESFSSLLE